MFIGALFHWSPSGRRELIEAEGLHPSRPATVASEPQPCVCLGVDPAGAWAVSGALDWVSDVDAWDLWQVRLSDVDQVCVRPEFGPEIHEVRVFGQIPPERVWWCARRGS